MLVNPEQVRAARALLRIEQNELARRAGVSVVTIRRLEAAQGSDRVASGTIEGVRQALEQAGVEFIEGGVRRRHETRPDVSALFEDLRQISLSSAERLREYSPFTESDLYDEHGLPT